MSQLFANLTLLVMLTACAHSQSTTLQTLAESRRCDEAAALAIEANAGIEANEALKSAGGAVVSLSAATLGLGSDIVLLVAGGVVLAVTVCSPALLFDVVTAGVAELTPECVRSAASGTLEPFVGPAVYRNTENLRREDYSAISQNLRLVAGCYEQRNNGSLDLELAAKQLRVMTESQVFWDRISTAEQSEVLQQQRRITRRLGLVWVDPIAERKRREIENERDQAVASKDFDYDTMPTRVWRDSATGYIWRVCATDVKRPHSGEACAECGHNAMEVPALEDLALAHANGLAGAKANYSFGKQIASRKGWVEVALANEKQMTTHVFNFKTMALDIIVDEGVVAEAVCLDRTSS